MALGSMGPVRLPLIQRPDPGNRRYGLFNVAPPQLITTATGAGDEGAGTDPNLPAHAFGGGLLYPPKGCGEAHLYDIVCEALATKTFDANTPEIEVLPFQVYASLVCGTLGYRPAYLESVVADRLFANEQHAVEEAFWTGSAGNTPFLTDAAGATDVGGGGAFANIVAAVAALEAFAYDTYGYNAVLHANSAVHAYAAADHLVSAATEFGGVWGAPSSEPVLRTPLGTKWVFGGGYPGTGPAGVAPGAGQTYIWITGNVAVWQDPVWRPPSLQQVMTRELNQYNVLAERGFMASYDCFHAYALVDIPEAAS